jgi:uncharacterized protein YxjI
MNMSNLPSSPAQVSVEMPAMTAVALHEEFAAHRRLSIRQRKKWFEMLTNFDSKNSYAVYDEEGNHTLQVKEDGSGFVSMLKRFFLRQYRPFTSTVYDNPIPKPMMKLKRPWRFYFHEMQVHAADGTTLGSIVLRFAWFRRRYDILDAQGALVAELFGPFLQPWTFEILVNGSKVGMIQKRWSGALKEIFTEADNFAVTFDDIKDPKVKELCFAATVLIDVVHFEYAKN